MSLGQAPAQNSGGPAYNPYNATAVNIALTGINILRAGESEGDEPYLLAYEYGVQIPVTKGVPQKPKPLPLRLVGKASFDGIRPGYDWAKPNNIIQIRGFNTSFERKENAWILFGLAVFVFDHDEYNETQLLELKRRATASVRFALEQTLATDPKTLVDPTSTIGSMFVSGFSPEQLKTITDMFKLKSDNIVGSFSVVLRSKPVGPDRGAPGDLVRLGGSRTGIPPSGRSGILTDLESPTNFFNEARYRGKLRVTGIINRHR